MAEESKNQLEDHELVSLCARIEKGRLREVLNKIGILVNDEIWAEYSSRKSGKLVEIIAGQEPEQKAKGQRVLNEIGKVGTNKKNALVILSALGEWKVTLPEGFSALSAHNMAAWCYVSLPPEKWLMLRTRSVTRNYRPGEWKVYELEFDAPPPEGSLKASIAALQGAMEKFFTDREQRGQHCRSDCFTVGKEETVIFKLTDHPDANEVWDDKENDFKSTDARSAFKVVVSFEYDANRLSIYYPDTTKQRVGQLANALSETVFGSNFRHAEQVVYDVSGFLRKTKLPSEPALGVNSARVVGLDVELDGSKKRRRSYFEEEDDLAATIKSELIDKMGDTSRIKVVRAQVRLEFGAAGQKRSHRTFTVSRDGVSGWKNVSADMRNVFLAYAKKINIIVDEDDTDAH